MRNPVLERLRILERQNETLRGYLVKAHERNSELKRQRDSLQATLRRCRESRDEWKRRAMRYQQRMAVMRSGLWDARRSRNMWRLRALTREVEEGRASPGSKGWLARDRSLA